MSEIIFTARNLTKQYQKNRALNGFHMEIRRGSIYGFVGGNGAGKTTLMRILTGRIRQTGGEIEIFGERRTNGLCEQRRRIGAMIEAPALYPGMTARDNLEVIRLQQGIKDKDCITKVLNTVGLSDVGSKKAKDFSLGMKQRLGLAMALLGGREFLVLDEPVNGLDPEGIVEFREILKKLNKEQGVTILISSHLLSELDQLATCYGFVRKGKMVEEITAEGLQEKCKSCLGIFVDDADKAAEILKKVFPKHEVKIVTERSIRLYGFWGNAGEVTKALVTGGVDVKEIKADGTGLEKYYMSVIRGGEEYEESDKGRMV